MIYIFTIGFYIKKKKYKRRTLKILQKKMTNQKKKNVSLENLIVHGMKEIG